MNGICGTCGREARDTAENGGYSDCCNDRIEYNLSVSEIESLRREGMDAYEADMLQDRDPGDEHFYDKVGPE